MKIFATILILIISFSGTHGQVYRVGAKHFNENYILGEMLAQLIESEGYTVERKFNLGGTAVCFEALNAGSIDLYPEYTGSLAEEILKSESKLTHQELNNKLRQELNLEITLSFGFNNTYALATKPATAEARRLRNISDLQRETNITTAFSYEFLKRKDGWENLKKTYQLSLSPVGIEHGLAYQAIENGKIELTDVYSTDGEIERYHLKVLKDDLEFFPNYNAVAVYSSDLDPTIKTIAKKLKEKSLKRRCKQ